MSDVLIFPSKRVAEQPILVFDFTSVLPFGATFTEGATATCTVFSGTDSNPSDVLRDSPITVTDTLVYYVPVKDGISGVIYEISLAVNYNDAITTTGIAVLTGKLAVIDGGFSDS